MNILFVYIDEIGYFLVILFYFDLIVKKIRNV